MKAKWSLLSAALVLGMSGSAAAFHDGGVAYCDACHTMHNSLGNQSMGGGIGSGGNGTQFQGVQYLLQGSDQSSTCLKCHGRSGSGSYRVFSAEGDAMDYSPGGDFGWLLKTFTWVSHGTKNSYGRNHGHNVVAADFGLVADDTLLTAPGGTFDATKLNCASCHDPHGRYRMLDAADATVVDTTGLPIRASGSYGEVPTATDAVGVYRILGGVGYAPESYPDVPFAHGAPIAVSPSRYNQAEVDPSTRVRVAYGQGMSEWCANCHPDIHNNALSPKFIHPAGNNAKLPALELANYNSYVKTGDMTGDVATAYSTLVPFEEGSADIAALAANATNDGTTTAGATAASNVMCLSCHRAHASGWDSMARWNNGTEFLTEGGAYHVYPDATARTLEDITAANYGRPATDPEFATYQRSLCNKCHAKD